MTIYQGPSPPRAYPEIEAPVDRGRLYPSGRPKVEARSITKTFTDADGLRVVLSDISLWALDGELVSIIGPSGCGKSTLFNILVGLEHPSSGTVEIDQEDVTGKVGIAGHMPQKDLLLPWKSVLDNTTIGLELLGVSRKNARDEALSWFPRFGLDGFERHYPATLSGGMRQRAALLRTILARRDILLLDEPFGALDALTRMDMQEWLLGIWDTLRKTVLFVTHDIDEAIYLSDRVYVMSPRPGSIVEVVDVPLPRPRTYTEVVTSSTFAGLKRELLSHLQRAPRVGEQP